MEPRHESLHEALIECVKASGGTKVVAAELWPAVAARDLDEARRKLANCLNPERPEKLSLDELLHILRLSRARGCHVGMQFLALTLGYADPVPLAPADERDQLQRRFLAAASELSAMAARIAELTQKA